MLLKLIRQYGEHGNEYSPVEMGDKINEIIDYLCKVKEPVIEEAEVIAEAIQTSTDGFAARSPSTADRVYLIKDNKRHWIKNPETLQKLGFAFSSVKSITNQEMDKYEAGEPINWKDPVKPEVIKPKDGTIDKYNL